MSDEKETFDEVIREMRDARFDDVHQDWVLRLKEAHDREILKYRTHACHDDGLMTTMSLEICNLRQALREALSGIDEFMTRTIYHEHGKDIERWRSVLSK